MLRRILRCSLLALLSLPLHAADFKSRAEHVVLVVWDGMRPDFIRPEITHTLSALAKSGTFFGNNHSVYITSKEVNGAAIATGCYPGRNGILANAEYRPEINLMRAFRTESAGVIRLSDAIRQGQYLRAPTIAEIVQKAGHRTAIAGTKPVALLHDRAFDKTDSHGSVILFAGSTYPIEVAKDLASAIGKFPDYPAAGVVAPNTAQNAWTTRALIEQFWKDGVPKFSTLWLGDPDFSQHMTQPGSPTALAGMANSDANLAALLAALQARKLRDKTDIFVVSDHGFSTIDRGVDFTALFKNAGFTMVRDYKQTPRPGEILLITLGGSNLIYVPQHDPALIQRVVTFLQAGEYAGPIFTRSGLPGTFTLQDARIDSPDSADIVFSFRWKADKNNWRVPGSVMAETKRGGVGTHASFSAFDVHNTLVAAGPDIRAGFIDPLPTANVDVAPTILHLLGIDPPQPPDGRILFEALNGVTWEAPKAETSIREVNNGRWRQYLKITKLGDYTYLDEGNSGPPPVLKK